MSAARAKSPISPSSPPGLRVGPIIEQLKKAYPGAHCALHYRSPYQLLVATILSAQCTDERVNKTTPALFATYPTPLDLALAEVTAVEEIVRPTGFFRAKARNLVAMAQALVERHQGSVPQTMEELTALPGVGRKTANVLLGNAFGLQIGITVDTHVTRISRLLKLTRHGDPIKIEQDLMKLVPREDWTLISHLLISHGRAVCVARRPRCADCALASLCPQGS